MGVSPAITRILRRIPLLVLIGASGAFAPQEFEAHPVIVQAGQTTSHKSSKSKPSQSAPAAKELSVPFRVGETLKYEVSWSAFATAANLELVIPEQRELYGWKTWHFRANAHTVSPVRTLFAIDDQFDSYTDSTTFESRQYENYLSEMGRKQDQQWRFIPEGQTPRGPGAAVIVPAGTRDPLGLLYGLRTTDWQTASGEHWTVYDGRNLYDVRANVEDHTDDETVPAGRFSTTRIAIRLFQREKEVSGINFSVWIAKDGANAPVLMKAQLPFGSLQVQLVSVEK